MEHLTIWVDYSPQLYQDLLIKVIRHFGQQKKTTRINIKSGAYIYKHANLQMIDVAVMSLNKLEHNYSHTPPNISEGLKLIAFSPMGICGWIYQQRTGRWDLIYPFELTRLLSEVLGPACYTQKSSKLQPNPPH
jgi:hypothetical protein